MTSKVIYIAGVARSGTSWIGQVVNSHPKVRYQFQPLFSYEFRDRINEDSTAEEFKRFFEELFKADSEFLGQKDKIAQGVYPDFKKDSPDILAFKENRFQSVIAPMMTLNILTILLFSLKHAMILLFTPRYSSPILISLVWKFTLGIMITLTNRQKLRFYLFQSHQRVTLILQPTTTLTLLILIYWKSKVFSNC